MAEIIIVNGNREDTSEIEELSIIDRKTGTNWVSDLLGNSGAVARNKTTWQIDGGSEYIYQDDDGIYHMTREQYDWWDKYITDYEATEESVMSLKIALEDAGITEIDGKDVATVIWEREMEARGNGDMEDEAQNVADALQEIAIEAGIEW